MSSSELLTATINVGILTEADADSLRLDDEFAKYVETVRTEVAECSDDALVERLETFAPVEEREPFLEVPRDDTGTYLALAEYTDAFGHEERLRLLTVIDQLQRGVPPADGSPDSFLPIHGDRLDLLFRVGSPAIVYVWLDDCDPCETMKDEFDELFPTRPDDVSLFSVYGPDWASLLQERYDITGGPTTLFVRNGSIDTRLYGAQYADAIEREVKRLRE